MKTTRSSLLAGSAMLALILPAGNWLAGTLTGVAAVAWLGGGVALADGGSGGNAVDSSGNPISGTAAGGTQSSPAAAASP
jgi:hypothetical protein